MKYKRIIAGFTFDLCKQYDVVVPDSWADKKVIRKFQKDNPELKVFNISSVNQSELKDAVQYA